MRRYILPAFVVAALLAPPSPSVAQSESDAADVSYREGNKLYREGKLAEARTAFEAAFRLKKTFDIAGNLGFTAAKLGQWVDAATYLSFALRQWAPTGKASSRASAVQWLDRAKAQVGTLTVTANAGAQVLVDGKAVGTAPLEGEVFVEPGARVVEAKLGGFVDAAQTVQAEKGGVAAVALTLAPVVGAVASGSATGGGSVVPPPAASASATVPAAPGGKGPSTAVLVTGGALTGVALVLGTTFAVVSNGKARDAVADHAALAMTGPTPCAGASAAGSACTGAAGAVNAQRAFANAAFWSFVGAGVTCAGTLIYALAAPKSAPRSGLRVLPAAGPQGAGIEIRGAW